MNCRSTKIVPLATGRTRRFAIAILTAWFGFGLAAPKGAHCAEPIAIGSDRQLFLDDFLIDSMKSLTRSLHEPQDSHANPVIRPDRPWEHRRISTGSVWFAPEEHKFRCWYVGMNIYDSRPGFRGYRKQFHIPIQEAASICYAESDDGVTWRKPNLALHAFRGSKENNIVLPCPGTHFDSTSVLHTPNDLKRPWKMYSFIGLWPYQKDKIREKWSDTRFGVDRHGHYGWSSVDGIRWTPMSTAPVLRANDRSMFCWDGPRRVYVASAKTSSNGKRAQQYASSRDGVRWTKARSWIHVADERDHPKDEAEAAYGFPYHGQYIGFCELRRERSGKPVRINWELMSSRDGKSWTRPFRQPFFSDAGKNTWRYQVLKVLSSPPIEREDELWIYYSGKTGRVPVDKGYEPFQSICLAKLRMDGFVSLDAGDEPGSLTTKAFTTGSGGLRVNADIEPNGWLRVAVLNSDGSAIESHTADRCDLIESGVRSVVSWSGKRTAGVDSGPIRLRFEMKRAKLYSFHFHSE